MSYVVVHAPVGMCLRQGAAFRFCFQTMLYVVQHGLETTIKSTMLPQANLTFIGRNGSG